MDETTLRRLIAELVRELDEGARAKLTSAELGSRLEARVAERAPPGTALDSARIRRVAGQWFSEWALAEAMRQLEDEEDGRR